jgi:hypothetical protein
MYMGNCCALRICFPACLSFERAAAHKVRGFDFIDYACLWNVRITGMS